MIRSRDTRSAPTWLYLVTEDFRVGPTKIGVAVGVRARLSILQCGNPRRLHLAAELRFETRSAAFSVEALVLKRLVDARLSGEWMRARPDLVYREVLSAASAAGHGIAEKVVHLRIRAAA